MKPLKNQSLKQDEEYIPKYSVIVNFGNGDRGYKDYMALRRKQ